MTERPDNSNESKEKTSVFLSVRLFCEHQIRRFLSWYLSLTSRERWVAGVIGAGLGALFLIVSFFSYLYYSPLSFHTYAQKVDVIVVPGDTARSIAGKVSRSGLGVNETVLTGLLRLFGDHSAIHTGRYRFERGDSLSTVVRNISEGLVAVGKLRVSDGMTFKELRALMEADADLQHTTAHLTDAELLKKLGATEENPEGLFAPDTYQFRAGVTDLSVYALAYNKQKADLAREWKGRAPGLKLKSPYEALILASIIEKETGVRTDRHLVSSVFHNRLKIWMPLQTDPTIIYAMGDDFKGRLRKRDLQRPGPYNSYLNYGLPPTPIAMPGLESIRAALHPSRTKYLYFVARGDGTTVFSNTLDVHNQAVAKYQKTKKRAKTGS